MGRAEPCRARSWGLSSQNAVAGQDSGKTSLFRQPRAQLKLGGSVKEKTGVGKAGSLCPDDPFRGLPAETTRVPGRTNRTAHARWKERRAIGYSRTVYSGL